MSQSLISPEAINEVYQKLRLSLPVYVPAMPSIILGLVTMFTIMIIGGVIGKRDADKNKENTSFIVRSRWLLIVLVAVVCGILIGDFVEDKHYTIRCIAANRQHYANVHWLRLYMRSYRVSQ